MTSRTGGHSGGGGGAPWHQPHRRGLREQRVAATLAAMADSKPDPDLVRFLANEFGIAADAADAASAPDDGWSITAPLWLWRGTGANGMPSKGAWYFITIDGDVADAIRTASCGRSGGFGSVKVAASVAHIRWQTSLFPSKQAAGYLLPVKASVRQSAKLAEGDMVAVQIVPI